MRTRVQDNLLLPFLKEFPRQKNSIMYTKLSLQKLHCSLSNDVILQLMRFAPSIASILYYTIFLNHTFELASVLPGFKKLRYELLGQTTYLL